MQFNKVLIAPAHKDVTVSSGAQCHW